MRDIKVTRPTQISVDANFPVSGKAKNISSAGDNTGTPWIEDIINDRSFGWQERILSIAGIVPNGLEENASQSQIADAIKILIKIESSGYNAVGSFRWGVTFTSDDDVGVYLGKAYKYVGGDSYPVTVPANTVDPSVAGDYEEVSLSSHGSFRDKNSAGKAHDDIYTRNFKSVVDLRNQLDATGAVIDLSVLSGNKVYWRGYYQESDGGSNWGIVKTGDSTSLVDDGGSIFIIVNDVVDGVWVEANLKRKKVNVLRFGAKSTDDDPTFDSTDAIKSALTYLSPKGTLNGVGDDFLVSDRIDLISKGLNNINLIYSEDTNTSTLVMTGAAKLKNVTITANSNRLPFNKPLSGIVTLHLADGVVIDDFEIIGGISNNVGIHCTTRASNVKIKNTTIDYIGWPILYNDAVAADRIIDGVDYSDASIGKGLRINNSSFGAEDKTSIGDGVEINCPAYRMSEVDLISVDVMKTVSSGGNGLGLSVANCDNVRFLHCDARNIQQAALHAEKSTNVKMLFNTVKDSTFGIGIGVEGGDHDISHNEVSGCNTQMQVTSSTDEDLKNFKVGFNTFNDAVSYGFVGVNVNGLDFVYNTIKNVSSLTGDYVNLQQTGARSCKNVKLIGNTYKREGSGTTKIISFSGAVSNVQSEGSVFDGISGATYVRDVALRGLSKDTVIISSDTLSGMDINVTRNPQGWITGSSDGDRARDVNAGVTYEWDNSTTTWNAI